MIRNGGNLCFSIFNFGRTPLLNALRTRSYFKPSSSSSQSGLNYKGRSMAKYKTITVSVDGNISSGKSTLVENLKELFPTSFNLQVELIPEPLDKWLNMKGHNLLQMYYEDPVKNNFMFQNYVQLTRLMETIKKPEVKQQSGQGMVRIMERSLQNNRYCFIELARREGNLQPEEFAVLEQWHNWMESHFDLGLDLIIYLQTSPETVFGRMKTRGREAESSVPVDYLRNLHETYEDWLIRGKLGPKSTWNQNELNSISNAENSTGSSDAPNQKVIVIDANQGKEQVAEQCRNLIRAFMTDKGFEAKENDKSILSPNRKRKREDIDNI